MLRWFARNDIAANFLLIAILLAGAYAAVFRVPLEVRPAFEFNQVRINMTYRGGTSQDVERTVVIPIERALDGLQGVDSIESSANGSSGDVRVVAKEGVNLKEMLAEIESRVARISTFPSETERPNIYIPNSESWWEVLSVAVTGDLNEYELRQAARQVRDELAALPGMSQVNVLGDRASEIAIEADDEKLIDYGLSFSDISTAIRNHSVDLPAGTISAEGGSLMLRTRGQAYSAAEYAAIPIRAGDGAALTVGDVATVTDGFEEEQKIVRFNGRRALLVEILRVDQESALHISKTAHDYVERANKRLPDGIELFTFDDDTVALRGRLGTLGISLLQGSLLVLIVLGLFLRPAIAFWVVIGIPVSFAGALIMMPFLGISTNLFSVFGFIIVLGIVVDDAIVTGENIYSKLREGHSPVDAAVIGAQEVATPVTFGILTTIVAFIPLMFFDGWWGNFTKQIPPIVAPVLIFSLIESKLILPSHLKHLKVARTELGTFSRFQNWIADGLETFVEKIYQPILTKAVDHRGTTLALFLALGFGTLGLIQSGKMGFVNMPSVERYKITARLEMASETPFEVTDKKVRHLYQAALELQNEFRDPGSGESLILNIMTSTGGWPGRQWVQKESGVVAIEIMPPEDRSERGPTNKDIAKRWREITGPIPSAKRFNIRTESSGGGGQDELESIEVQLRGPMSAEKTQLTRDVADLIRSFEGISNAWDDSRGARAELEISLKPRAGELGLTQRQLASQVRQAFFGEQAQRIQRERDDIRVMVRLPEKDRESLHTLETLKIRLQDGSKVPFRSVATATRTSSAARIARIDGSQTTTIGAAPVDETVDIISISEQLAPQIDELVAAVPRQSWRFDGYIAEHDETFLKLAISGVALFLALYALLAIPFKSLIQPFFVLVAIPFGVIGALVGHLILDITPSYLSVFGMLALAGVVVNDSLVMVDFINVKRLAGLPVRDAVLEVGAKRFRPILLTSLTTFAGLMPLILDTSIQAQFLIPMAVSLAFGILFATVITLFLIPCTYLATNDLGRLFEK